MPSEDDKDVESEKITASAQEAKRASERAREEKEKDRERKRERETKREDLLSLLSFVVSRPLPDEKEQSEPE